VKIIVETIHELSLQEFQVMHIELPQMSI